MDKLIKKTFLSAIFFVLSGIAVADDSAYCISHATQIPYLQSVCFASSMKQYMCVKRNQSKKSLVGFF